MKHLKKLLAIALILSIYGCAQEANYEKMNDAGEQSIAPKNEVQDDQTDSRKLIKEGTVAFVTEDLQQTRKTVFDAVSKYKAYVSFDQEYNSPGRIRNILKIRIPSENFDKLLGEATKGVEKFERKEITVKDVTEEFLDVEARLKTKKELEQRYIELLKTAKNIPEILEVEKQIGLLRSEIESVEGRLRYLKDRVSFSTLSMNFYEEIASEKKSEFGEKFNRSLQNGWEGVILFFIGIANFWPLILVFLGALVGVRVYRKKMKSKSEK